MTTGKESTDRQAISDAILDEPMSGYEKPEDLLGDDGLFKELKRRPIEKAPGAELTDHPAGYFPSATNGCQSSCTTLWDTTPPTPGAASYKRTERPSARSR